MGRMGKDGRMEGWKDGRMEGGGVVVVVVQDVCVEHCRTIVEPLSSIVR